MKIINYDTKEIDNLDFFKSIFLAGPSVRPNQSHLKSWRKEAIDIFKENNYDGSLIIPEFNELQDIDEKSYSDLPLWEFKYLNECACIMFWIPRTKEMIGLTTNCEFGYWLGKDVSKVVYGRPKAAYKTRYLDVMWEEHSSEKIFDTLEDTVKNAIKNSTIF
jgi:hypothetical protein